MQRNLKPGTRVRIADCSGVDSNKTGVIMPLQALRLTGRGIPDLPGEYRPWTAARTRFERLVRLDDGSTVTMFRDRLTPEPPQAV